jgi:hypothetical protein
MPTHRIVFEIEVDAETSLEAAQTVEGWLHDTTRNWQYYVQDTFTNKVDSVDLSEEDEDAVLPVDKYEPLIK